MKQFSVLDLDGANSKAEVWAATQEFALRQRAYRVYRVGRLGAGFIGISEAMRNLGVAMAGHQAAPGAKPPKEKAASRQR